MTALLSSSLLLRECLSFLAQKTSCWKVPARGKFTRRVPRFSVVARDSECQRCGQILGELFSSSFTMHVSFLSALILTLSLLIFQSTLVVFCLIWQCRFVLFLLRVCYFIVFCLIWQYLLGRFDGFCGISFSVCIMYLLFYVILPFVFCLLLFCFILFLVDVLQSGMWRDANCLSSKSSLLNLS